MEEKESEEAQIGLGAFPGRLSAHAYVLKGNPDVMSSLPVSVVASETGSLIQSGF